MKICRLNRYVIKQKIFSRLEVVHYLIWWPTACSRTTGPGQQKAPARLFSPFGSFAVQEFSFGNCPTPTLPSKNKVMVRPLDHAYCSSGYPLMLINSGMTFRSVRLEASACIIRCWKMTKYCVTSNVRLLFPYKSGSAQCKTGYPSFVSLHGVPIKREACQKIGSPRGGRMGNLKDTFSQMKRKGKFECRDPKLPNNTKRQKRKQLPKENKKIQQC